jgi:hypothetical protein
LAILVDFNVKNPPVANIPAVEVKVPVTFNAPAKVTPAVLLMVNP